MGSEMCIRDRLQAGKFIGGIAKQCGGGGGGRPNLAQAGGRDGAALPAALESARSELAASLKTQDEQAASTNRDY